MRALIVHPRLDLWAGGEYIALETASALQKQGYNVFVACENFDLDGASRYWGMRKIMGDCSWVPLPKVLPRATSLQRIPFLKMVKERFRELDPDVVFNTQLSTYVEKGENARTFAYHHGDLLYFDDIPITGLRARYYSLIRKANNFSTRKCPQ